MGGPSAQELVYTVHAGAGCRVGPRKVSIPFIFTSGHELTMGRRHHPLGEECLAHGQFVKVGEEAQILAGYLAGHIWIHLRFQLSPRLVGRPVRQNSVTCAGKGVLKIPAWIGAPCYGRPFGSGTCLHSSRRCRLPGGSPKGFYTVHLHVWA